MNFKIHVPAVGEISKSMILFQENTAKAELIMDEVMQVMSFCRNYSILTNQGPALPKTKLF